MRSLLVAAILAAVSLYAPSLRGQERPKPPPESLPVEVVLSDLREAYSTTPTAEEVNVRFRSGSGDRSDTFTIRIDPGPAPAQRPRAVLLELGQLNIYLANGRLTAINTAAPDKFYQRSFTGPITPGRLADLLPPLPLPQLAIINPEDPGLLAPLNHLRDVSWTDASVDQSARPSPPLTLTMNGAGPTGSIALTALVSTVRLTKLAATFRRGDTQAQLELSIRQVDPGDPASWSISTEGRQAVSSLTELRTTPRPLGAATPGQSVPNVSLSKFDLTGWTLYEAADTARPKPVALILFKAPADAARAQAAQRDALIACSVLRSLHLPTAGDATGAPPIPLFASAAAIVIELPEFSRERWSLARQAWARETSPGGTPSPSFAAADLMWSPGALESIDRFAPGADALLILIRPDAARTLAAAIKLDNPNPPTLAAEIRKALAP